MKKILCLLLAIACLLAVVSCGGGNKKLSIAEIVESSKPYTVTTRVYYDGEDDLGGMYITTTDGTNSIFEYEYERYATVAEMAEGRIKTVSGKIYYKDGKVTSNEGESWESSEINEIVDFSIKIDESKFSTYKISKDGKTLTGTVSSENSSRVLGVAIASDGDISIEIVTDGEANLYYMNISYKSAGGALITVNTSYDYSPVTVVVPGAKA